MASAVSGRFFYARLSVISPAGRTLLPGGMGLFAGQ